jgi:hypothetical protein
MPHKMCENLAMAKRRVRENPSDPNVTYWVVLAMIVTGSVAVWGYKAMTDRQKKELGVG